MQLLVAAVRLFGPSALLICAAVAMCCMRVPVTYSTDGSSLRVRHGDCKQTCYGVAISILLEYLTSFNKVCNCVADMFKALLLCVLLQCNSTATVCDCAANVCNCTASVCNCATCAVRCFCVQVCCYCVLLLCASVLLLCAAIVLLLCAAVVLLLVLLHGSCLQFAATLCHALMPCLG